MKTPKTVLSFVLGLLATGVLLHFVFSPFYEDLIDAALMWDYINWFMAAGILATLITTCIYKKSVNSDAASTNAYICANVAFYAAAVLAILFFWNWFDNLTAGEDGQSQTRRNYWPAINALFVVLLASVSAHLCRDARRDR